MPNPFENLKHFSIASDDGVTLDILAIAETLVCAAKISESQFTQGPGDYKAKVHELIDQIWAEMTVAVGEANQ